METHKIELGTMLYKHSTWSILEYKVIEIQSLKTLDHNREFFIVECLSCQDHKNCIVALKFDDYGALEYSHMVNHYDECEDSCCDKCYKNIQYYWHNDGGKTNGKNFFFTKKDCMIDVHYKNKEYYEKKIKENEESIIKYKNQILDTDTKLSVLTQK